MKYFLALFLLAMVCIAQDEPPTAIHRSAITPPLIMGNVPLVRHHPRNTYDLYMPEGKEPAEPLLSLEHMEIPELLDRLRTNTPNLYLLVLTSITNRQSRFMTSSNDLRPAMITSEDMMILSNFHLGSKLILIPGTNGTPQHP